MIQKCVIAYVCVLFVSTAAIAQDGKPLTTAHGEWPQFLGPTQNGISSETNLTQSWSMDGPKELWRANVGTGMSTVSASGGKLFTVGQADGKQSVVALDAKTGKQLWSQEVSAAYKNGMGDGPRATPAVNKDHVFVHTGEGILVALKVEDGSIAWKTNLVKELGGKPIEYGISSSPLSTSCRGSSCTARSLNSNTVIWSLLPAVDIVN